MDQFFLSIALNLPSNGRSRSGGRNHQYHHKKEQRE
jgi:hypothetical protein